jgi:hypothetical protein
VIRILWLLGAACCIMSWVSQLRRSPAAKAAWDMATAIVYTVLIPLTVLTGDWPGTGVAAFLALIWWLTWWLGRRGRRRKRSLRGLGFKARARLAAVLRNMPRPGPVLRPVPQGARAVS